MEKIEKRQYIRLYSVFPVTLQFFLPNSPKEKIYQGFTRDVGLEGLCVEVSDLDDSICKQIYSSELTVRLGITMPLSAQPTHATARAVWLKGPQAQNPLQFSIGFKYETIDQRAKKRIFAYAKRVSTIPRIAVFVTVALALLCTFFYVRDAASRYQNRLLIAKTVKMAREYSVLDQRLWMAQRREEALKGSLIQNTESQEALQVNIATLELQINSYMQQKLAYSELNEEKEQLQQRLLQVNHHKTSLERELAQLGEEKDHLRVGLTSLKTENKAIQRSVHESLYQWLKTHQVASTGLVISFEGDRFLKDWAFTYDQSLSAQVFTISGDYDRAKKIFNFYRDRAEKSQGGFLNAYEINKGKVTEYVVHSGPNIWLGIALAQYTHITDDQQYLSLAQSIADWVISLQEQDNEFGIKGGPQVSWFSTEHNLDAYSLFSMLYRLTGQERYRFAFERTLAWLKIHAYNDTSPPIKRGRGDSTIATDTFSWAICSLGPKTLLKGDMDPEQIISYAEENCVVTVEYQRPDKQTVNVTGFDFSKFAHTPRKGVVSTEWTAQMIVAYQVMADFFFKEGDFEKANYYNNRSEFYLNELNKMVISSPSKTGQGKGCLPYASSADVDTGHGWRTPKGDQTGSLAGTAYTIFAFKGYNPLVLSKNREEVAVFPHSF